ncbi:MAG: hypothetical protein JWN98_1552 [Abditibacteriota bacterium]|nr:hypothetical protein [Abditibacteriota bacterium]
METVFSPLYQFHAPGSEANFSYELVNQEQTYFLNHKWGGTRLVRRCLAHYTGSVAGTREAKFLSRETGQRSMACSD